MSRTPDMKIRVSPALRSMIEAAAKVNGRTLNAEIAARLQWSFDAGYDADSEMKDASREALKVIRASPLIRMERQMISIKAQLEAQIEALAEEVETLKSQIK